jgi:AmiR/NasT family two-component response regulator
MTSVLIHVHGTKGVLPLAADLEAAGIQVLGIAGDRNKLVQEVVRHAPDLVICDEVPSWSSPTMPTRVSWLAQLSPVFTHMW